MHVWLVGEFGIVWRAATAAAPGSQQHSPVETHALRRPLRRRASAAGPSASTRVILRTEDGGDDLGGAAGPVARALALRRLRPRRHGLDRRRLGHRAQARATAAPPGGSSRCPIQLAARWLRSVWLTPTAARGLAVGAEGLVFRIDGGRARAPRAPRGGASMIPKRWVEAYLRFLLRRRLAVAIVDRADDGLLRLAVHAHPVLPQFLDFYPSTSQDHRLRARSITRRERPSVHQDLQRLPPHVRQRQHPHRHPRGEAGRHLQPDDAAEARRDDALRSSRRRGVVPYQVAVDRAPAA